MARSIKDIKLEMTTKFMANEILAAKYGFSVGALFSDEFSIVSFENVMFDVLSFIHYLMAQLFDSHKAEVLDIIEQKFPHRPAWYRDKALAFQYGHDLIADTDKYDNTGYTDDEIEESKIIKYSAVTKNGGQLLIKIASENDGVLSPIDELQKASFDAYIDEIADAGVNYLVVNNEPDILLLNLQIFRDPLVLNENGMSILNGNFPVQDAIFEYMKELPFNGELVLFDLETKLKTVEGVRIPNIVNAESQIIDINTGEYKDPEPITVRTVPASGYFTIPDFNNVSYVV